MVYSPNICLLKKGHSIYERKKDFSFATITLGKNQSTCGSGQTKKMGPISAN